MKRDASERMWELAYELARSGRFGTWDQVATELHTRGLSLARQLLDAPQIRKHLDTLCAEARNESFNPERPYIREARG